MKRIKPLAGLCLLTFLVSCNDVSSNRKQGSPETPVDTNIPVTPGESNSVYSQLHREKGALLISTSEEIAKTLTNTLPATYRTIPLMEKDDQGSEKNVLTRTNLTRPGTECGNAATFSGIDARIADCSQKNADKAIWEGLNNGAAGEGTWKLVSLSADGEEIWLDTRTGMVWSDLIVKDDVNIFNWCQASGNTEDDTPTATINCRLTGALVSLCAGNTLAGLGIHVKWRLPTRNDFLQADLNGYRLVLKPENQTGLWTATMRGVTVGRTEAWVYDSTEGTLTVGNLNEPRQVRCIGTPVR